MKRIRFILVALCLFAGSAQANNGCGGTGHGSAGGSSGGASTGSDGG